jgi:hypothetical protein
LISSSLALSHLLPLLRRYFDLFSSSFFVYFFISSRAVDDDAFRRTRPPIRVHIIYICSNTGSAHSTLEFVSQSPY